jgi:V8-like Glu-specific endopeptidase
MKKEGEDRRARRPLHLDEVARLKDSAATEAMPAEVAARLAESRLYIEGLSDDLNPGGLIRKVDGRGWELRLPHDARLGRTGVAGKRLNRKDHQFVANAQTKPMRPAWAAQSFQPRQASSGAPRPSMRRLNGRLGEPYYGVFGQDDRQVYYPANYPWQCVGRIFSSDGGDWYERGSGVLVGPRHVLTAGHLCPWDSQGWSMLFVPGYWDGSSVLGAGASSYTSDFYGWDTYDRMAYDIAVLRLFEPLGSWLGWMGTKVYDPSWQGGEYWTLAGYPRDVAGGGRPSYQSAIPVLDADTDGDAMELEHHGDVTPGDSGGPFFGTWDDGPYAIGTTSGGEMKAGGGTDEDNNIEAAGAAMVNLVQWALSNWA